MPKQSFDVISAGQRNLGVSESNGHAPGLALRRCKFVCWASLALRCLASTLHILHPLLEDAWNWCLLQIPLVVCFGVAAHTLRQLGSPPSDHIPWQGKHGIPRFETLPRYFW